MRSLRRVAVLAVATLVLPLSAAADVSDPGGTFTDDNGNTHEGTIEAIAAENITRGCNPPANTEYCPDDVVTRGAMAAFLVRALGLTEDGGQNWFTDDDGHLFENDINKLAAAGVTKGCNPPDNTLFCPDDVVVRDAMASFLARANGFPSMPPPPVTTFGAGTHIVGDDIPAGTYRNSGFSDGCYWERLSGFSGDFDDIIANEFTAVSQVVTIDSGDAGFHADSECGLWTNQLVSVRQGAPFEPFGPGTYRVPEEVTPGTWQSTPVDGESCYWERRSGFSNELADIIANDFTDSPSVVDIADTDVGFLSEDGCGVWTKVD